MRTSLPFTTTLSQKMLIWLNEQASKQGITKRAILETALREYQKKLKKQELINSFKRAAQDQETLELAEMGLSDYLENLQD